MKLLHKNPKPALESEMIPAASQPPLSSSPKVPWSPWMGVFYAIFIYFAAQFVASLLIIVYPKLHHWDSASSQAWLSNSVFAQFWYVLVAEALTFGAIAWFIKQRG